MGKARKNPAAVALAARRMVTMTAEERSEVARIAGQAAGLVHAAKAAARRAAREIQAADLRYRESFMADALTRRGDA